MPLEYPTNDAGDIIFPAEKEITHTEGSYQGVDSLGERYRAIVEFDVNSEAAYDGIVSSYPDAWDTYFGTGAAPSYSADNALLLQEALAFYFYVTEDESYGYVQSEDSIDFAPYIREEGSSTGTYENPDAFYDADVYDRVTSGGTTSVPRVQLDGSRTVSSKIDSGRNVDYTSLYSSEQLSSTEYETVRNGPRTAYDWGGSYATGKNTY